MKLAKLALIGAVSLTSVAAVGTSAFAEEKANMKSKTDVMFIEDTSITDPNNPENPNEKLHQRTLVTMKRNKRSIKY